MKNELKLNGETRTKFARRDVQLAAIVRVAWSDAPPCDVLVTERGDHCCGIQLDSDKARTLSFENHQIIRVVRTREATLKLLR